jgi:hypothetical protein
MTPDQSKTMTSDPSKTMPPDQSKKTKTPDQRLQHPTKVILRQSTTVNYDARPK